MCFSATVPFTLRLGSSARYNKALFGLLQKAKITRKIKVMTFCRA